MGGVVRKSGGFGALGGKGEGMVKGTRKRAKYKGKAK